MAAEEQAMNITKCTRCHMRHTDDMFGSNRLGEKFKTCNTCREKKREQAKKNYHKNLDKSRESKKAYYEANKDKISDRKSEAWKQKMYCVHGTNRRLCGICMRESRKVNPHLHCMIEGHCGWVDRCGDCRFIEYQTRLQEAEDIREEFATTGIVPTDDELFKEYKTIHGEGRSDREIYAEMLNGGCRHNN